MCTVTALLLGDVAGCVGGTHGRCRSVDAAGERRDTDAHAEHETAPLPAETKVANRVAELQRETHRPVCRAMFQQDAEFVATEARQAVALAHPALQQRADLAQQFVPRSVAAGIVDHLELVEVEITQRVGGALAVRAVEYVREPTLEFLTVDEAGQ